MRFPYKSGGAQQGWRYASPEKSRLHHKEDLRMSMGGRLLEWLPTRTSYADILPACAGIGVMSQSFLPCVCRLITRGADAGVPVQSCRAEARVAPRLGHSRRVLSTPIHAAVGDARRNRHASWGVSNVHLMERHSDGQSASLRLLCPHEG